MEFKTLEQIRNKTDAITNHNLPFNNINENLDLTIIKTDLLEKEDVDLILKIPGVLNLNLKNKLYYNLSYDSAIIKGSELIECLNFILANNNGNNYENQIKKSEANNFFNSISKNKYKITYTNEFKKNICELYQFNPTTNFTRMLLCIILLAAIFLYTFVCQTFDNYFTHLKINENIHFFLLPGFSLNATMIYFYGFKIYKRSLNAFINSYLVNMDTLISLGSISAIFLTFLNFLGNLNIQIESITNTEILKSNVMTLHSAEAAAAVIAISVIGKYVEEKAKNNIKKLTLNMFSDDKIFFRNYVNLVKPRSKDFSNYLFEKKIDMGLLEKEDFCKISSGDFLLFDCEIIKGKIEINENSDYGFNKILKKTIGDKLKSGTQIVSVLEPDCIVSVKDVVEESLLFKVIKEMNLSLNQKLKFQHFIDKIIKWFVPLIILISISTSIIWLFVKIFISNYEMYNFEKFSNRNDSFNSTYKNKYTYLTYSFILERAISILVVSCPCAFGLAIPTVTTIALNKALKSGILIKNLSILPEIRKANCFVFDKTGTLTSVKNEVKVEYYNEKAKIDIIEDEQKSSCFNKNVENINKNKNDNMFLPIYEIISLIESDQKHPIAEILYSYAVKQIENDQNRILGKDRSTKNSFISSHEKESISLINNSLKITSNGIEAILKCLKSGKNFRNKNEDDKTSKEQLLNVLIGNATFIFKNKKIELNNQCDSERIKDVILKLQTKETTNIFLCINQEIHAVFSIDASSCIRPEIDFVLESLRKQNKKTLILSGDNKKSVENVAKKLSFLSNEFYGEVNHTEKKEILQSLKNANKNLVLMVGDGINDVLSLTEANYGISFNANSQLNLVASDIIFIKEDLSLILSLLKLSKLTYIFIWINIFWAFIYNIFMIPIASGMFYGYSEFMMSPTVSSLSMLCSSLLIILTSNLLRLFDIQCKGNVKSFDNVNENNLGNYDDNSEKDGYKQLIDFQENNDENCCESKLKLSNELIKVENSHYLKDSAMINKNKEIYLACNDKITQNDDFNYNLINE